MPKLVNKNPKMGKLGKYAVVRLGDKPIYLKDPQGRNVKHGTPEALTAYNRFCVELQNNPAGYVMPSGVEGVTIQELCAGYIAHIEGNIHPSHFCHYKTIISDFLLPLYGDFAVDAFTTKCLKNVRQVMINARNASGGHRLCRKQINDHVKRIVALFRWGVEEDIVAGSTWHALKAEKALRAGEQGTFDHAERVEVPDDVVALTLRYLPSIVSAMVQIQGMTGMRPTELCTMRVGDVDRSGDVWEYRPKNHKTEEYIGKKIIYLGKDEQRLIAPYLIGRTSGQAVFSPAQAMAERFAERRANRKTKIPPSQAERDSQRAKKPVQYAEFYDASSYRNAVGFAIAKAKREGVIIPHWTPYQLRHGAGTRAEKEHGLDEAQALLHHTSAQMTKRYAHGRQEITKNMARNRVNPFATVSTEGEAIEV